MPERKRFFSIDVFPKCAILHRYQCVILHMVCTFTRGVKYLCPKCVCRGDLHCFVVGQFCSKFTHFPSVKFSWLKMCACKKQTNISYTQWMTFYHCRMRGSEDYNQQLNIDAMQELVTHFRWSLSCEGSLRFILCQPGLKAFAWWVTRIGWPSSLGRCLPSSLNFPAHSTTSSASPW